MIEMIGVLAVLAILATIIISATPRQLDVVATNLESTNLVNYANALQNSILRNRYIPGTNDMAQVIATELGMDVKDVNINGRYNQRAFLSDPDMQFYTNGAFLDSTHLVTRGPWQQNIGGAFLVPPGATATYGGGSNNPPQKVRLMIVSSLTKGLPGTLATLNANDFNQVWATTDDGLPNVSVFSGYGFGVDDLKVQRIDLSPLFVHLILYNYNYPASSVGQFTIDPDRVGAIINTVPNGQYGIDTYFLRSTVLGLLKSTSAGGTLDANQILNRDTSFAYALDTWRSSINLGEGVDPKAALFGNALWAVAQVFQSSPANSLAVVNFGKQVTPPIVVTNIWMFMSNYVYWASNGFPSGAISNSVKNSQDVMVSNFFGLCGSDKWRPSTGAGANSLNFSSNSCYYP
jgi:type II secretory pathway pseudopilin PulG